MYNPASFAEERMDVLHSFIRKHPLGIIVSAVEQRLEATHVPVVWHAAEGERAMLRFHFARANPHWKQFEGGTAVLAIFQGPEQYITPSWYPSKQEHGKVVPTWNYLAVHVRGRVRLFDRHEELVAHLYALTDANEAGFERPWSVDDAPANYLEGMSKAIVGVELAIETIEGKWKVSQNRAEADRLGVVAGLRARGDAKSMEMAQLVKQRGFGP